MLHAGLLKHQQKILAQLNAQAIPYTKGLINYHNVGLCDSAV